MAILKETKVPLTHELLSTFMAEVAAIVNNRPLVPVSTDPGCPWILTPATILTLKTTPLGPPPGDFKLAANACGRQWRRVQHLAEQFWVRCRGEYLPLPSSLDASGSHDDVTYVLETLYSYVTIPTGMIGQLVALKKLSLAEMVVCAKLKLKLLSVVCIRSGQDQCLNSSSLFHKGVLRALANCCSFVT